MVDEGTYSYLPDDCWEYIFKFITNNHDEYNNCHYVNPNHDEYNNCHYLNPLSVVSKQFLSITDSLRFSLTVVDLTCPFLCRLFERFVNLNSLKFRLYNYDPDKILHEISRFPSLKLTSLNISRTFPANGLRAFSQKITTLTSLTCFRMSLDYNKLLLIADCFPLLKQLNIPFYSEKTNFINAIQYVLSKCPCIQHLDLHHTYFLNNRRVNELSLFLGNLASINLSECWRLTQLALFSLIRNCPSLSEIKMEKIGFRNVGNSISNLVEFGVHPQIKSLYLGRNSSLSDKHIIMFASMFPNLELLDLYSCNGISEGICQVLRICCKIKHLNLAFCKRVKLLGMNFVVPKLEVLNLSFTQVYDETLYVISKSCCGLQQLLLENCYSISEGIYQVLRRCCKLRYLNLAYCSRVKIIGINFVVPKLEVLNLSYTQVNDETLFVISNSCCGLQKLLLLLCCEDFTMNGVNHVLENCTQLREISCYAKHLRLLPEIERRCMVEVQRNCLGKDGFFRDIARIRKISKLN